MDLDSLQDQFRWHQYQRWRPASLTPAPFPDACGDCGRHRDEHPYPWLPVGPEMTGRLFLEVERLRAEAVGP